MASNSNIKNLLRLFLCIQAQTKNGTSLSVHILCSLLEGRINCQIASFAIAKLRLTTILLIADVISFML